MKMKNIAIIISVLVPLSVLSYFVVTKQFKKRVQFSQAPKQVKGKQPNINTWLKEDFNKITAFYNSPIMHYNVEYHYYLTGNTKPDEVTSAELWMKNGNYLFTSDSYDLLRNSELSIMVDKLGKVILIDSAFSTNVFTPMGFNIDSALLQFDTINRTEDGDYWTYNIPSNKSGIDYTIMKVFKKDMSIASMEIYSEVDAENPNRKPSYIEIHFKNISTTLNIEDGFFKTNKYVNKGAKEYTTARLYNAYKIMTKQTQQ